MDVPVVPKSPPSAKKMRWLGFFMFIGGGALAYLAIIMPLIAASRHEDDVSISLKLVMLGPALIILGLILLFMGNDVAGRLLGSRREPTALGVALCLAIAAISILLYEWLKHKLREYGYAV
jgi:hypothetical protein